MQFVAVRRWTLCLLVLILPVFGFGRPLGAGEATPAVELPPLNDLECALLAVWTAGEESLLLDTPIALAELEHTYFSLLERAPELFWVADRFHYTAVSGGVIRVDPVYLCPLSELPALRAALEETIACVLTAVPSGGSDYARAYALHDALADVAAYGTLATSALGEDGAYTAYGALVDGTAVCRGYAMAYMALLARTGILSEYVHSDTMAHGWVRAYLDGEWVHIDVTWDDRSPTTHRRFARDDAAMAAMGYTGWQ